MKPKSSELIKVSLLTIILLSILLFIHFSGIHDKYLTPEKIRSFVQSFGPWAPAIFILLYALPIFSDSIFAMVGGMTFGPLWGTIYSITGAIFSSSFSFFISRYLGRKFIERLLKEKLNNLDQDIERYGFRIILFMRLVPIFPYEAINYGSGLTKIKYKDYLFATALGIIPGAFAYNYFGSSLLEATSSLIFVPISIILLLLLFGPLIYNYFRKTT